MAVAGQEWLTKCCEFSRKQICRNLGLMMLFKLVTLLEKKAAFAVLKYGSFFSAAGLPVIPVSNKHIAAVKAETEKLKVLRKQADMVRGKNSAGAKDDSKGDSKKVAAKGGSSRAKKKKEISCFYCGKPGHKMGDCKEYKADSIASTLHDCAAEKFKGKKPPPKDQ